MVANRCLCFWSLGVIKQHQSSQNITIFFYLFRHFFGYNDHIYVSYLIIIAGKCLVRHSTSQWMGQHDLWPFFPFPGTCPGFQGSKNVNFMAKSTPNGSGGSRFDWPTWKVSVAPYHIPMDGTAWLVAIFSISRHLSRVPGCKNGSFYGWIQTKMAGVAPG